MNRSSIKSPKHMTGKRDGSTGNDSSDTSRMNGVPATPDSVRADSSPSVTSNTAASAMTTSTSSSGSPQLPLKPEKKGLLNKIKKKLSGNPNRKKWRNGDSVSPDDEFECDNDTISPIVPMRNRQKSRTSQSLACDKVKWAEINQAGLRKTIAAPPVAERTPTSGMSGNRRIRSVINSEKSPNGKLSYVKCGENVPVENGASTSGASKPNYAQADEKPTGAKSRSATMPAISGRLAMLPSSSFNSSTGQRLSLQRPVAASPNPDWVYQRRFEPVYQELKEPPRTWTLTKELFRLSKFGWYWGPLSRAEAEEKLLDQPDGAFLVRDSSDERYLLSLSFRSYGKTLHTRIEHLNGVFSFYALPECEGYNSIVDLIENSVKDSKNGVFCYSRSRSPNGPSFPVRLTTPVSRFTQVRTLQYLCRFVIRQFTRLDHIQKLPLPNSIKGWLEESQF